MKRKAVFMDIDGTLMENGVVSLRVIDAIQRARAQGHLFFVCTGRSKGHMPEELLRAEYLDGYVMGCGMHCVMGDRTIHRERVSNKASLAVARYFLDNGRECLYECENSMLAINSSRPGFEHFSDVESLAAALDDAGVSKITAVGPYREDDAAFFSKWFDVYDMGTYSDVVKRGVTKATGMQHVLEDLGISRENCIGVGDSANDLPMIEFAGLGVAMGNAPDEVKVVADAVTESCANDGVAVMIERFVLGEEPDGAPSKFRSRYPEELKTEKIVVLLTGGSVTFVDKATRKILKQHKGLNCVYWGALRPGGRECMAQENGRHFYIYSMENFERIKRVTLPNGLWSTDVIGVYSEDGKVLTIPANHGKDDSWTRVLCRYETENYSLIDANEVDEATFAPYCED